MAKTKLTDDKKQQVKRALIEALTKSLGNISTATKVVGINRTTFYDYYNEDDEFRQAVHDIKETAIDFAESALLNQIKEGNTTAIIFFLKTQGKSRGYVERQELSNPDGSGIIQGVEITIKRANEAKD